MILGDIPMIILGFLGILSIWIVGFVVFWLFLEYGAGRNNKKGYKTTENKRVLNDHE